MHPEDLSNLNSVQRFGEAMRVLGNILKIKGRKKLRAELEIRMRLHRPEPLNAARSAPMAKRRARRERVRELRLDMKKRGVPKEVILANIFFRPVIGYDGLPAPDHKETIGAMKFAWLHRAKIAKEKKEKAKKLALEKAEAANETEKAVA